MDAIGISGIASGIDFQSLIAEIIRVESRPIDLVDERVAATQRRIEGWRDFQSRLEALRTASGGLSDPALFGRMTAQVAGGNGAVRATVTGTPAAGTTRVQVNRLAAAERLGSRWFEGADSELGLEGSFRVAGRTIAVGPGDSVQDLAESINRGAGGPDGVTASLVTDPEGRSRLVLRSSRTGASGIDLADGPRGVLRALGLLGDAVSVKHPTSDGVASDSFGDPTSPLAGLVGTGAGAGTVQVGNFQVALDLASLSLDGVAAAINAAADSAGSRVEAAVETTSAGSRLVIRGTTGVQDDGGVLEALGIVSRSRESAGRRIEGASLTTGGVPAGAGTLLAQLDGFDGLPAGTTTGDSLVLAGVRGDGTSFALELPVDGSTTLQDVVDALNGPDAFGAGERTATASISPEGRIVVEDGGTGGSQLSLSMVARNEGGGTLSPGTFVVAREGYEGVLTAGVDAEAEVDGILIRSSTNLLDGVVPGLSLQLGDLTAGPVDITVSQDRAAAASAVQAMVAAYNTVVDFIRAQSPGPLPEGAVRPPLAADGALRSMSSRLRSSFLLPVLPEGSPFTALGNVGVAVDRDGRYTFDRTAFDAAMERDPRAVAALFANRAVPSAGGVSVAGFASATREGSYAIQVTQAATRAGIVGTPLPGGYPADADPDLLVVRDLGGGGRYAVELAGGAGVESIAAALNAAFASPTTRRLELPSWQVAGGAPATGATLLTDLEGAGGPLGIQEGETLTLSGTTASGTAFLSTVPVGAGGISTVDDLVARVQDALGPGAMVSLEAGRLVVEGASAGAGSFELALSASAPGGGVIPLGPAAVVEEGRARARLEARVQDGALAINALDAGSAAGFEIQLQAVGVDDTAALGLAAGVVLGTDVQGTIGGYAATGNGDRLLGGSGTPAEGLSLSIGVGLSGDLGSVDFARGVAARLQETLRGLLEEEQGGIPGVLASADQAVARLNDRISVMEARLARRRDALIRRFTAMEEAVARAQAQSNWLASQLGSLSTQNRNGGGGATR